MTAADVDGWDSLNHIQIIHKCEEELGIQFTLEEIANLQTIGDLLNTIERHL